MFNAKETKIAIVEWIKNYFQENGKESIAVVGISGGKDSSVVASLCVNALGADRVFGVLMPQGIQSDIDVAIDLVKFLDIKYTTINIGNTVNELIKEISQNSITPNLQMKINTPARIRMTTLYAVAASLNGRVANTCNLSEDWVGYSTKYGDSAGDFSPLSNLTVHEVKQIGAILNIPSKFVDKTPIDGLSNLTDEDNLGFTYEVLDKYIREGICEDEIVKNKIDKLHLANLHKLKPMPSFLL